MLEQKRHKYTLV